MLFKWSVAQCAVKEGKEKKECDGNDECQDVSDEDFSLWFILLIIQTVLLVIVIVVGAFWYVYIKDKRRKGAYDPQNPYPGQTENLAPPEVQTETGLPPQSNGTSIPQHYTGSFILLCARLNLNIANKDC